jgi:hypothetical protein
MTSLPKELFENAFSTDPDVQDEAREKIIDIATVSTFYECVDEARRRGDEESLEFWLIELVTSRGDAATIGKAIHELSVEVLGPQKRYREAMTYLTYIRKSVFNQLHSDITETIDRFEREIKANNSFVENDAWKSYDIATRIEKGKTQQHYFDRFVSYFTATKSEKMDPLIEDLKIDYLPRIIGYFQGVTGTLEEYGVESETVIGAFNYFLKITYPNFVPGAVKLTSGAFGANPDQEISIKPREDGEPVQEAAPQPATKPASKGYAISKK